MYGLDTAPVVLASLWQGRGVGSVVMKIASGSCPISVPACSDLNSPISSHYAGPHKFCVNDTKIMITTSDTTRRLFFQ